MNNVPHMVIPRREPNIVFPETITDRQKYESINFKKKHTVLLAIQNKKI